MKLRLRIPSRIALVLLVASWSSPGWSGEAKAEDPDLPGVDADYSIVRPAPPEPESDRPPSSSLAPGEWEITVSGSITVDISTGNLPPARR